MQGLLAAATETTDKLKGFGIILLKCLVVRTKVAKRRRSTRRTGLRFVAIVLAVRLRDLL